MALCFLQVLREPVVQYLAGSEQRIAPFWNIITWYPTNVRFHVIIFQPVLPLGYWGLPAFPLCQPVVRYHYDPSRSKKGRGTSA